MRVIYRPESAQTWAHLLHQQAAQSGHGMPGFVGARYQRGAGFGSIFSGLLRTVLPLAKSAGKAVGREALRTGASVASDILSGQDAGDSLKAHTRQAASRLLKRAGNRLGGGPSAKKRRRRRQTGHGLGYRSKGRRAKAGARPLRRRRAAGGSKKSRKRTKGRKRVSRKKRVRRDQLGLYLS